MTKILDPSLKREVELFVEKHKLHPTFQRMEFHKARDKVIVSLIAEGLTGHEIGQLLQLSHRTIETRVDRIINDGGYYNRVHMVASWIREGKI